MSSKLNIRNPMLQKLVSLSSKLRDKILLVLRDKLMGKLPKIIKMTRITIIQFFPKLLILLIYKRLIKTRVILIARKIILNFNWNNYNNRLTIKI